MNWEQILTVLVVVATNLGTVIALYMHSDSKMETNMEGIRHLMKAMNDEMKDFHGRLCAIEERNKR